MRKSAIQTPIAEKQTLSNMFLKYDKLKKIKDYVIRRFTRTGGINVSKGDT